MKAIQQKQKESAIDCPVCGKFKIDSEYDICEICFWEYDPSQYDNPAIFGGANNLSINDYKKWWNKLVEIMPNLMKKHQVVTSKQALWTYDEMIVPRKNIKEFVRSLSKHSIAIRISFYNLCEKYGYNRFSFVGYICVHEETIERANEKSLEIIFCDNPIRVCEQYDLKQVLEILNKSEDKIKTWMELTPNISIEPNPRNLPKH